MKYTSAQANKLLKKLNDEYSALLDKEQRSRDFRAAMGEDIESVRPAYDYAKHRRVLKNWRERSADLSTPSTASTRRRSWMASGLRSTRCWSIFRS